MDLDTFFILTFLIINFLGLLSDSPNMKIILVIMRLWPVNYNGNYGVNTESIYLIKGEEKIFFIREGWKSHQREILFFVFLDELDRFTHEKIVIYNSDLSASPRQKKGREYHCFFLPKTFPFQKNYWVLNTLISHRKFERYNQW